MKNVYLKICHNSLRSDPQYNKCSVFYEVWMTLDAPKHAYARDQYIFQVSWDYFFSTRDIELPNDTVKSDLSVDWMVTEWLLDGDWMVDFSRISVTI